MAEGQTLTPRRKDITIEEMRRFSGPGKNVHTDQEVAEEFGMPAPIMEGMQGMGYISEWLFEEFEDAWLDRSTLTVKFVDTVLSGDTLVIDGTVAEADGDRVEVEIECRITGDEGDRTVIVGSATVHTDR